jgi:class 3 adenylate cyclase/Tfp pilus assembly protein PilF
VARLALRWAGAGAQPEIAALTAKNGPSDGPERPDEPAPFKRKLAAILAADVKGYSRVMEADEEGALRTLTAYRRTVDAVISRHEGRVVSTAGDSILAEFASPVQAVRCAVEFQEALEKSNAELPRDRQLEFRIGINLGDVIVEGTDLFGDAVNVAARLQSLADPGGICISGSIYDQVRTKLRLSYEFLGAQKVKNIAEPVPVHRVHRDGAGKVPSRRALSRRGLAVALGLAALLAILWVLAPALKDFIGASRTAPATDRASIAVLPFANQSSTEDDYFSDGLSEDLISALAHFSGLRVVSWNAVVPYKDQDLRPQQLVRDFAVRYIVDGGVRRSGDQIRVTARLSDAEHGTLLWSERYDEQLRDVFAVQDDITRRVVNTLAIRVNDLEQERAFDKPTENLTAYDYYLRGRHLFRRFTRADNLQAREMFETAVELDHDYAEAYAALAWTETKAAEMGWTEFGEEAFSRARELAQAALNLDPLNELAHVQLGVIHAFERNYDLALGELRRATEANPNFGGFHAERGFVLLFAGQLDEAIDALEEALRYDPKPTPNTFHGLAVAYYFRQRYDEAIVMLQGAIERYPQHVPLYIVLAANYAAAGQAEDAERAAANVRRYNPFFDASLYAALFRDPASAERLRRDLQKAGL